MKIVFLFFLGTQLLFGELREHLLHDVVEKPYVVDNIRFLDAKELRFKDEDAKFVELSALAYHNNTLYALSDKGILFHLDLQLENDKIQSLKRQKSYPLQNKDGEVLKKKLRDSEGLAIYGDDLLISFEHKNRVDIYTPQGLKIGEKTIHELLQKNKNYEGKNKGLEALAYNPKYGTITAPEEPLKNSASNKHTLYSINNTWQFPAIGSLTALEFIDEDTLMILQRDYNIAGLRWLATISKLDLKTKKYEVLAHLDSNDGWNIDNFEGLCKVGENRYLIVSDDNDKVFQKTLLLLFELR